MDPTEADVGVNQIKIEDEKEGSPEFRCNLYDSEVVRKIAQILLLGLSTACVDNTTGDLFKGPALVAVDTKKEMVDYLTQRSETYVAESVVEEGGPDAETSDHPSDIISDFIDDFSSIKRNLFSRVSGWVLSERREDRIDDFVQEMEMSGFWLMDRRETIAQTLLKNLDFKNTYTCDKKYYTAEELADHTDQCKFRIINCSSEGCDASFCALHKEKHDAVCSFMYLPCEQGCPETIMRHEMDRHCITVCQMKLGNCRFYSVGCRAGIPVCKTEEHMNEALRSHVQCILQVIYKEASIEDLNHRMDQLDKLSPISELSAFRDVRSLTNAVKRLDAQLGPLEHVAVVTVSEANPEKEISQAQVPGEIENQVSDKSPETGEIPKISSEELDTKVHEQNPGPSVIPRQVSEESLNQVHEKNPDLTIESKQVSDELENQVQDENHKEEIVQTQEPNELKNKVNEENLEATVMPEHVPEESDNQNHENNQENVPKEELKELENQEPEEVSEQSEKERAPVPEQVSDESENHVKTSKEHINVEPDS